MFRAGLYYLFILNEVDSGLITGLKIVNHDLYAGTILHGPAGIYWVSFFRRVSAIVLYALCVLPKVSNILSIITPGSVL